MNRPPMIAEKTRAFGCRNVKNLVGKRPDREKEILGFLVEFFSANFDCFQWNFQQIPASVPVVFVVNFLIGVLSSFRIDKEENPRWLKFAFQTKIQWCVVPSFLK